MNKSEKKKQHKKNKSKQEQNQICTTITPTHPTPILTPRSLQPTATIFMQGEHTYVCNIHVGTMNLIEVVVSNTKENVIDWHNNDFYSFFLFQAMNFKRIIVSLYNELEPLDLPFV